MGFDITKIDDSEILYRVVGNSDPNGFIYGTPSAALFMDENGVSVDRDGGRSEEQIIKNFEHRFGKDDCRAAVKIKAGICRSIDTYPNPTGNKIFLMILSNSVEILCGVLHFTYPYG